MILYHFTNGTRDGDMAPIKRDGLVPQPPGFDNMIDVACVWLTREPDASWLQRRWRLTVDVSPDQVMRYLQYRKAHNCDQMCSLEGLLQDPTKFWISFETISPDQIVGIKRHLWSRD